MESGQMLLLAYEVDTATVNWLIVTAGGCLLSAITAMWAGSKQLAAFFKPYIVDFFTSHKNMVDTMSEQVPIVSATLSKLCETTEQHSQQLDQHGKALKAIKKKIGADGPDDSNG